MTRESSNEQLVYLVEGGETEHSVARLFGVRVDAVRRANPRVGGLRRGDVLVIPPVADTEYVRWCEAMTGMDSVEQNRRRKLVPKSQAEQARRKSAPQIVQVSIDADKLRSLIKDRLDYGDCAEYVAKLINKAASLSFGTNPAKSTDILSLYDEIRKQPKGGIIFQAYNAPHLHYGDLKIPAGGGGWAWGRYADGNATINLPPRSYYSDRPSGANHVPYIYGHSGLHEVIHLSGKNATYTDALLTRAARLVEPDLRIGTGDQAWDSALKRHSLPLEAR